LIEPRATLEIMPSQIQLMRHGRSALPFPKRWLTPAEFRDWIGVYNRTGIADDGRPSAELIATVADTQVVACSDYPRSVESAARLFPNRQPIISEIFREVGRPLQGNWNIRLPLHIWDQISVWLWNLNLISSDESIHAARQRAQTAVRELVALAQANSRVVFIGHGMLNSLIARELRRQGWQGPRRVNDDYWGIVSYVM
jgi:broad specificity phosphatase PhoE